MNGVRKAMEAGVDALTAALAGVNAPFPGNKMRSALSLLRAALEAREGRPVEPLDNDTFHRGIRENGTVEGYFVETYYLPCKGLGNDAGFVRVLMDDNATDAETRVPYSALQSAGWVLAASTVAADTQGDARDAARWPDVRNRGLLQAAKQALAALKQHAFLPWGQPGYPTPCPGASLLYEARSYLKPAIEREEAFRAAMKEQPSDGVALPDKEPK